MRWPLTIALAAVLAGCTGQGEHDVGEHDVGEHDVGEHDRGESVEGERRGHAGPAAWLLEGSEEERFARVARQLRGFDVAMVEVGYRYTELYWAGQDANWGFARYQVEKIRTAIANGLERRPARASSAAMIDAPLAAVERAIEAGDRATFDRDFDQLTATCNACHVAERVPFVTVTTPTTRLSPVFAGAPPEDSD